MQETIQASTEMDGKYLTFFTDGQLYGIPIADVVQIVGVQSITTIPEYPSYAKGIINLRGSIIPLIDMRLRLGKVEAEYDERTCIIVTLIGETAIGYIVDSVDAVTTIDEDAISPPPKLSNGMDNAYLTGVARQGQHIILLLSAQRILSDAAVSSLVQHAEPQVAAE